MNKQKEKYATITIFVRKSLKVTAKEAASKKEITLSRYLRNLLKRDLKKGKV